MPATTAGSLTEMENSTECEENDNGRLKTKVLVLEKELEVVSSELESVKKKLSRIERQYEKSTCYNEELRHKIEDLTGQLHVYRTRNRCDAEVQVVPGDLPEVAPRTNTQGEALPVDWSGVTSVGISEQLPEEKLSIADSLKAAAEEALQDSGVVYHAEYGMYYDYNTGYYHDPERSLYYEPHSGVYYYYNQETQAYEFHSQVDLTQFSTPQSGRHDSQPKDNLNSAKSTKNRGRRRDRKPEVEKQSHHHSKKKKKKEKERSIKHKKRLKKEEDDDSPRRKKKRSKHKKTRREKSAKGTKNDGEVMDVETKAIDNQKAFDLPETTDNCDGTKEELLPQGESMETEEGEVKAGDDGKDEDADEGMDEDESELEDGECSSDSDESDSVSLVSELSDISSRLTLSEEEEEEEDDSAEPEESQNCEMMEEPAEEASTRNEEDARWYPPSIRAMVTLSSCLEEGTMFLIPYLGCTVGREPGHLLHLPEEAVSRTHAEIQYREDYSKYMIQDKGSSNGTWLNKVQVTQGTSFPLSNGDEVKVGSTEMTLHIHPGTTTCDDCEPGIVRAKLAQEKKKENIVMSKADRELARRKELKNIKKRYGLKNMNYVVSSNANASYEDKAEERRKNVGSEDDIVRVSAPASVHVAISEENKGHRMLAKMGWKSGEGLGRSQPGITEPIHVTMPASQSAGLGSSAAISHSLDVGGAATQKWIKARRRYENLPEEKKGKGIGAPQENVAAKKTYSAWVKGATLEPDEGVTPEHTLKPDEGGTPEHTLKPDEGGNPEHTEDTVKSQQAVAGPE